MLPKRIEYILILFDAFGYNSGSTKLSNSRKAALIIYTMNLSMLLYFTFVKVQFIFALLSWYHLMEVINYTLQYSAGLYAYWFIILDSILHRELHHNFWLILHRMNMLNSHQHNFSVRCCVLKFLEYLLVSLMCVITMLLISVGKANQFAFSYHSVISICAVRVFYYVFCLEILHFHLTIVDENIIKNKNKLRFLITTHRLKWIRELYSKCYEMTICLNKTFSFSQIVVVSFCFHQILSNLNWFYMYLAHLSMVKTLSEY